MREGSTGLRLAGFAASALGGLLTGLGALLTWATVGLRLDTSGALDSPVHGVDVWEGFVVLGAGVVMLVAVAAMRAVGSAGARRALAGAILAAAAVALVLGVLDLSRAETRFGASRETLDAQARKLATALGAPYEEIRLRLEREYSRLVVVDVGPGLFAAVAGGALGSLGGGLGMAWVARGLRPPQPEAPPEPEAPA